RAGPRRCGKTTDRAGARASVGMRSSQANQELRFRRSRSDYHRPHLAADTKLRLQLASTVKGRMAVAEGFEPWDWRYPSHAVKACSLGRSDTPPRGSLPANGGAEEIAVRR